MDRDVTGWSVVSGDDLYGQSHYSNGVEIFSTQWDFTIEFFHMVPSSSSEPGEQPTITRNMVERIAMSPSHAKAFMSILQGNIAQYEEQFGQLPDHPLPE